MTPVGRPAERRRWSRISKQRGLLDETLVIWGGEFGRTVYSQGQADQGQLRARPSWPRAFTLWMAGGGIKAGPDPRRDG
jgi:hypothetical protein